MKGWKTKNKPKDPFEPTWDWVSRKQPVYCGPHGSRIIVFINGLGICNKCANEWIQHMLTLRDGTQVTRIDPKK